MSDTIRLAKHLAALIGCSRREAEQYIEGGWVTVDGEVIEEPGFRVEEASQVVLHEQASLASVEPVTILLHKPAGASADAQADSARALLVPGALSGDDRAGIRFLKRHLVGLSLCTPLEQPASGLVIYSQDYRIKRKLLDDARHLEHEYIAEIAGELSDQNLKQLNHGLSLDGKALDPVKVSWQSEARLRFAIKGPLPDQIERMCEAVGVELRSLKRIRIGRLPMAGLAVGEWRYLSAFERV